MIPVDSIRIPCDIQELCEGWADGANCKLHTTRSLTLGSIRPKCCDTEEKWYLTIWREFANALDYDARLARKSGSEDYPKLACAKAWVDDICDELAESYGLEDWDRCDDR